MTFFIPGKQDFKCLIRLADKDPQYWVFRDMKAYIGKRIRIAFDGKNDGIRLIRQEDDIVGADSLYAESNRPRFHFTSKRGWLNDPNGLIYFDGEYHLFYQHNPFENEWENMSWGHAVSTDLIHWKEIGEALEPDAMGSIFSGSTIIDYDNSAGFNKGNSKAMLAFYTIDNSEKQVQAMAFSLDKGRTWTKFSGNPLIDSKAIWNSKDTRDPRVFWFAPSRHWVMVLNERSGHSIYTSSDLKKWIYKSHTNGFWECPDLFKLPVDNEPGEEKWIMSGASGVYMVGNFNGETFIPESEKLTYTTGALYAAQTFNNMPSTDPRRIQFGWGKIVQRGMPFNGMMLLPTELRLKKIGNQYKLYNNPIREVDGIFKLVGSYKDLDSEKASELANTLNKSIPIHIRTRITLTYATSAGLDLSGQNLISYDLSQSLLNGRFYSPIEPTSMDIVADIYIDRTSVEVFIDNGAWSFSMERATDTKSKEGFKFWGNEIKIKSLEIFEGSSTWKK